MIEHYKVKKIMPGVWNIEDYPDGVNPYVNMYLLEGDEKALLIDAGESKGDLKGLVSSLTKKPVELIITHGHGDHAAAIAQFDKVYMSHKDVDVLKSMMLSDIELDVGKIIDMKGGEIIDLGGYKIEVIALSGHTQGSMVLLDNITHK
ncbi:MAG TPA: MBL fold metallo-hydrolase [Clostridiaceae bacterium]